MKANNNYIMKVVESKALAISTCPTQTHPTKEPPISIKAPPDCLYMTV